MKKLFAAILAIAASTSAIPAYASPLNLVAKNVLASDQPIENHQYSSSNKFGLRSLNIAKQIPNEALGLLMLDLDASSWQIIDKSQTVDPIVAIDKLFSLWGQFPNISIVNDLKPWLGKEVAIAFLINSENKKEFSFVALAPITDHKKFADFLKKLKSLDLPKPTETLYQNVTIWEWQLQEQSDAEPEEEPETEQITPSIPDFSLKRFAIAQLPIGMAVMASDRQAIQQIIDTTEASSLADSQLFLRSLNNPLWDKSVIAGYGSFKALGQISELLAADLPETSEIPGFNRAEYLQGLQYTLAQYSSLDLFTWITPKGIRSQSNNYFSEVRSPLPKDTANRDRLLSYLPSNIYGSINSRNFNRQWQWFVE
ncbi:MAG: DUF3352 domain-containing protein, partial [Pseudanabaena sp. ELA748]